MHDRLKRKYLVLRQYGSSTTMTRSDWFRYSWVSGFQTTRDINSVNLRSVMSGASSGRSSPMSPCVFWTHELVTYEVFEKTMSYFDSFDGSRTHNYTNHDFRTFFRC